MQIVDWSTKSRIKGPLNARLKAEGHWNKYNELRAHLIREGVPAELAWRVAAFPFPPKEDSAAEIVADPMYAEIEAKWKNGSYPTPPGFETFPNGATDFTKSKEPTREAVDAAQEVKKTPARWKATWRALAAKVGTREASELEESRWVVENYLTDASEIDPADVPSRGALGMLSWVQESSANYGDFLRTNHAKLLPDKKALEYKQRYEDDGRPLKLLDEFMVSFWRERLAVKECPCCDRPIETDDEMKEAEEWIREYDERRRNEGISPFEYEREKELAMQTSACPSSPTSE